MKVQEENGLAEPVLGDVPEPDGSVHHDVNFTGTPQPAPPRLRLHRRPEVHGRGVRWAGHHIFLNEQATALIGTRNGGALRLGDTVAVTIGGVDAPRGRVDLLPVDRD